jgi:calcineurin-like phosphoesterase family protein
MIKEQPNFIIQMGDFCRPEPRNKVIMYIWNRFPGRKYHVLSNHDAEMGCTREQAVEFWKAEGKYYPVDQKHYHLIMLDGNDHNPAHRIPWQYERYISDEQLQWLEDDLDKTNLPVIVFCHQANEYAYPVVPSISSRRIMLTLDPIASDSATLSQT